MNRKILVISLIVFGVLLCVTSIIGVRFLSVKVGNKEAVELFVYHDEAYDKVVNDLVEKGVISKGHQIFSTVSKLRGLDNGVRSGRYVIESGTRVLDLVKMLDRGLQTPVKLVINKVRLKEDFAKKLSEQLMITEDDILLAINETEDSENFFDRVIPNTYEVYWTISAEKLVARLENEADKWWRNKQGVLNMIGLTRHEAIVLASIVEEETIKNDEKSTIAGVYVNRLRKDMLLQADPTVKYAVGNFALRRVLYKHLETDSPYNTYKYKGLPPTAICLPSVSSLLAVLDYEKHDYLFFCAREDFSGYHSFARTAAEHGRNAARYRNALNKNGVK